LAGEGNGKNEEGEEAAATSGQEKDADRGKRSCQNPFGYVAILTVHGCSLNGKYAKKVMDNAFFVFDEFAKILTAQCRNDSVTPQKIDKRYEECKSAFLLCDGAFSTAHKIDPTAQGRAMY